MMGPYPTPTTFIANQSGSHINNTIRELVRTVNKVNLPESRTVARFHRWIQNRISLSPFKHASKWKKFISIFQSVESHSKVAGIGFFCIKISLNFMFCEAMLKELTHIYIYIANLTIMIQDLVYSISLKAVLRECGYIKKKLDALSVSAQFTGYHCAWKNLWCFQSQNRRWQLVILCVWSLL